MLWKWIYNWIETTLKIYPPLKIQKDLSFIKFCCSWLGIVPSMESYTVKGKTKSNAIDYPFSLKTQKSKFPSPWFLPNLTHAENKIFQTSIMKKTKTNKPAKQRNTLRKVVKVNFELKNRDTVTWENKGWNFRRRTYYEKLQFSESELH